jgi:hypothetical protein
MRLFQLLTAVVLGLASVIGPAIGAEWQRLVIMGAGTSVEIPVSIFTEETELPDGGIGPRLYTEDRRADLTVQSVANPSNDSPATFLAKKNPPRGSSTRGSHQASSLCPASEKTEFHTIAATNPRGIWIAS